MRKVLKAALVAAVSLTFLTGCTVNSDADKLGNDDYLRVETVNLEDGRSVVCVVFVAPYRGGITCDWDNAD